MEAAEKRCTSAKVSIDGDINYAAIGIVRDIRKDMAGTLLLNLRGFHQAVHTIKRCCLTAKKLCFHILREPFGSRKFARNY